MSHPVLYEVFLILEDSHKFIKKIMQERISQSKKATPTKVGMSFSYNRLNNTRDISNYEELKQPLLENDDSQNAVPD